MTSLMTALYFLTSSVATIKAQFIGSLYYSYGKQVAPATLSESRKKDLLGCAPMEKEFYPALTLKKEVLENERLLRKDIEIR